MAEDRETHNNVQDSLLEARPAQIRFTNIHYSVKTYKFGLWLRGEKEILSGVNGLFQGGKLTALIGESGCGKTSLLDILSGYRSKGVVGEIYLDDDAVNSETLIKRTCYIRQDVVLQPLLTAIEAVSFVMNITLTAKMSSDEKKDYAESILQKLMLLESKNTLTKNLSGGEQKRLTLALDLISNPSIILLDEPTSGLDSQSSLKCIEMLKKLSNEGRTIICCIHQASMLLLEFFDGVYMMSKGRCAYQGTVENLIPFLTANNFTCPQFHNPTEFVLELCLKDDLNGEKLVNAIGNGKALSYMKNNNQMLDQMPTTSSSLQKPGNVSKKPTRSFFVQFPYLLKRKCVMMGRDMMLCWLMLLAGTFAGVGFGLFFYNTGDKAGWAMFNYNMMFFLSMNVFFNGLISQIICFPLELQIMRREYFNGWYSLSAYWSSLSISSFPILIISTVVMGASFYYLAGYPLDDFRVARFVGILMVLALAAQDYGILLGTLFSMKHGLLLGNLSTMPIIMFAGFFLYYRDCPFQVCRWLFDVSVMRKSFEEMVHAVYGFNREPLVCDKVPCPFTDPVVFMKEVDMQMTKGDTFWSSVIFIGTLYIVIKLVALTVLKYKCSRGV